MPLAGSTATAAIATPVLAWLAEELFWCWSGRAALTTAIQRHMWLAVPVCLASWLWLRNEYQQGAVMTAQKWVRGTAIILALASAAVWWWASGHTASVLTCAVEFSRTNPNDLEALLRLGAAFEAAAEDPGGRPPARNTAERLESLLPREDLRDGAYDAYLRAAELHRNDWRAPYELAGMYFVDGECESATALATMAEARAKRLDEPERRRALRRVGVARWWKKSCAGMPRP